MRKVAAAVLALALLYAAVATWLSGDAFAIAAGSDAGVRFYTPATWLKVVTLAGVTAAWGAAWLLKDARVWKRVALAVVGFAALGLSTHVISFNYRSGFLEEHWLLWRRDVAGFNVAEGVSFDWVIEQKPLFVRLVARRGGAEHWLFTGIPPWNLDLRPSLQVP
jgi:hypothetical protein